MAFSQVIPFMNSLGFSESLRSWMWTVSALVGMICQFFIGYISDRYQKMKPYILVLSILFLILSGLGYALVNSATSIVFLLISLFVAMFKVSSNLIETWTIQMNHEVKNQFGLIRIFGSIGWAIGAVVVAWIIEDKGFEHLPIWIVIGGLIMLLIMSQLPDSEKLLNPVNLEMRQVKELFQQPQYVLSLMIFFILFIVYALDSLTVIDRMVELQASNEQIGVRWSFMALIEIPVMVFGMWFIRRYSAKQIVKFTALMYGLRFVLYGFAQSPQQMILFSALQGVTFPFLLLTQKILVDDYTPPHLRASGHMIMTAITSNIPIILMPLLNAWLHQVISYSQILILSGLICLIPLALSFKLERTQS